MDLKANLLTKYYFDNNILYTLSSKFYDSISSIKPFKEMLKQSDPEILSRILPN